MEHQAATLSFKAIHTALAADERTREPMNALAIWTEIGRSLSGTLEQKGASPGLLREVIADHCRERGAAPGVDLGRWAYRLAPEDRLSSKELGAAIRRVMRGIEEALPELVAEAETATDKHRELFMAVVRGWFPVGLDIVRALPAGAAASEAERLGALGAWCERYLPGETAEARDLGVRVERAQDT
ncbi:MAG: hypothetical protein IT372_18155 [Polyangiaceae bacterium]|nr:hypothetical protein [Polyangiaceae bacterium]